MKPHLISFKLCPFVQRSVIVLLEKGADFDIEYINLQDPPSWFLAISPLGKVPVLKVGETVVFESAVIMEYLDEVTPPALHPADPLKKAQNRAWIEFASALFMDQFAMLTAPDEAGFNAGRDALRGKLRQLEQQVVGRYFNGDHFALVDAAYAPLFMRLRIVESWMALDLMSDCPKINQWADALLERPSVRDSVVPELPDLYENHIGNSGSYFAKLLEQQPF